MNSGFNDDRLGQFLLLNFLGRVVLGSLHFIALGADGKIDFYCFNFMILKSLIV